MKKSHFTIIIATIVLIGIVFLLRLGLMTGGNSNAEQYIIYAHLDSTINKIRQHKLIHRDMDWKRMELDSVIENSTHDTIQYSSVGLFMDFDFYYKLHIEGKQYVFHGRIDMRDSIPTTIRVNAVMFLKEGREWGTWIRINNHDNLSLKENERLKHEYESQVLDSLGLKWSKNYIEVFLRKLIYWM